MWPRWLNLILPLIDIVVDILQMPGHSIVFDSSNRRNAIAGNRLHPLPTLLYHLVDHPITLVVFLPLPPLQQLLLITYCVVGTRTRSRRVLVYRLPLSLLEPLLSIRKTRSSPNMIYLNQYHIIWPLVRLVSWLHYRLSNIVCSHRWLFPDLLLYHLELQMTVHLLLPDNLPLIPNTIPDFRYLVWSPDSNILPLHTVRPINMLDRIQLGLFPSWDVQRIPHYYYYHMVNISFYEYTHPKVLYMPQNVHR